MTSRSLRLSAAAVIVVGLATWALLESPNRQGAPDVASTSRESQESPGPQATLPSLEPSRTPTRAKVDSEEPPASRPTLLAAKLQARLQPKEVHIRGSVVCLDESGLVLDDVAGSFKVSTVDAEQVVAVSNGTFEATVIIHDYLRSIKPSEVVLEGLSVLSDPRSQSITWDKADAQVLHFRIPTEWTLRVFDRDSGAELEDVYVFRGWEPENARSLMSSRFLDRQTKAPSPIALSRFRDESRPYYRIGAPGYTFEHIRVDGFHAGETRIDLERSSTLNIKFDTDKKYFEYITMLMRLDAPGETDWRSGSIDEQYYPIQTYIGLPPGQYKIQVRSMFDPGTQIATATVELLPGDNPVVTILETAGAEPAIVPISIRIKVPDSLSLGPSAFQLKALTHRTPNLDSLQVTEESPGLFLVQVAGVPAGRYALTLHEANFNGELVVTEEGPNEFEFEIPGTISITVEPHGSVNGAELQVRSLRWLSQPGADSTSRMNGKGVASTSPGVFKLTVPRGPLVLGIKTKTETLRTVLDARSNGQHFEIDVTPAARFTLQLRHEGRLLLPSEVEPLLPYLSVNGPGDLATIETTRSACTISVTKPGTYSVSLKGSTSYGPTLHESVFTPLGGRTSVTLDLTR